MPRIKKIMIYTLITNIVIIFSTLIINSTVSKKTILHILKTYNVILSPSHYLMLVWKNYNPNYKIVALLDYFILLPVFIRFERQVTYQLLQQSTNKGYNFFAGTLLITDTDAIETVIINSKFQKRENLIGGKKPPGLNPCCPIFLSSGDDEHILQRKFFDHEVMNKPIDLSILKNIMTNIFDKFIKPIGESKEPLELIIFISLIYHLTGKDLTATEIDLVELNTNLLSYKSQRIFLLLDLPYLSASTNDIKHKIVSILSKHMEEPVHKFIDIMKNTDPGDYCYQSDNKHKIKSSYTNYKDVKTSYIYTYDKACEIVIDLVLFAGVLGTSQLLEECIKNVDKMTGNIDLFIFECARINTPVTSVNCKYKVPNELFKSGGTLIPDNTLMMCPLSLNHKSNKFENPESFNIREKQAYSNLLTWNCKSHPYIGTKFNNVTNFNQLNKNNTRICPGINISFEIVKTFLKLKSIN